MAPVRERAQDAVVEEKDPQISPSHNPVYVGGRIPAALNLLFVTNQNISCAKEISG